MKTSTNMGLNLPEGSDRFDYKKFLADNFQKIDDKIKSNIVEDFVATSGQTVITLANAYVLGTNALSVEIDGVPQVVGVGYTETTTNSITMTEALTTGTRVKVTLRGISAADDARFAQLTTQLAEKAKKLDGTATLIYYVSPSGNNSNDGLTASTPFKTVEKAFDTLKSVYNVVDGIVKIDLAAGVYEEQIFVSNIKSKNRIQLLGKKDANGVPTVIFEGANNANLLYGITFSDYMNVTVQDIKFQNFANSVSRSGLVAQNYVNLWTINVHAYNCGFAGISVNDMCRLYVTGGVVDACRIGIRVYSNCVCTIGYNNPTDSYTDPNHTIVKNCTEEGVLVYNMSTGHLDFSELNANNVGVVIQNSSRLHVWQNLITNNTKYGVLIGTGSTFYNDTNTYTSNALDVKRGAYSNELSDNESYTPLMKVSPTVCLDQTVLTGTTTETYFNTINTNMAHHLVPSSFINKGQKLKIIVTGTFAGANTKTVQLRVGTSLITGYTSVTGSTKNFILEVDYYAVSATSQKVFSKWTEGNSAYNALYTTRTAGLTGTYDITVTGTLADPTASITVETFEVREIA